MGHKYVKKYEVNTIDFDENRQLRAITIVNFLQDISTRHYQSVMRENGRDDADAFWVIVEWEINMHAYPNRAQMLTVTTDPIYFRKFIAYRAYTIVDEEGKLIATAQSKWAYMDLKTRRQANIPTEVYEIFGMTSDVEKPERLERFSKPEVEPVSISRRVSYSDIDVNGHVNNGAYFSWVIDALPEALKPAFQPDYIQIHYKQEVFKKALVTTDVFAQNQTLVADITEGGRLAVQCLLKWS